MYIKTLRVDYLFSVIVPVLLAVYINDLIIFNYIKLIGGWIFIGIAGNLLNDAIDQDRELIFTRNHLLSMFLISLCIGILLMLDTFISSLFDLMLFSIAAILVVLYCVKLKKYPIINKFVLVFSHIIIPYLIIEFPIYTDPLFWSELSVLVGIFFFGFAAQVIHEVSDEEAFKKFSQKTIRIIILLFSILSIIFITIAVILLWEYYLIPLMFPSIGMIVLYRKSVTPTDVHKKAGILVGNLLLFYFIFIVFF
ncbi:MAG: hypothetical protein GF329_09345 [Candidatus Lokiarchaeota archaeon]|nr:hypothetical protein [Candidatus Lokiarchaeota archaeon]